MPDAPPPARDAALLALRPRLTDADGRPLTAAPDTPEAFQNEVLRPILKLQHPLLLATWHRYAERQKGRYHKLNRPEREAYLRHALQTNRELRSFLLGLVCAVMTEGEWGAFRQNERELSRRALALATDRLNDGLHAGQPTNDYESGTGQER